MDNTHLLEKLLHKVEALEKEIRDLRKQISVGGGTIGTTPVPQPQVQPAPMPPYWVGGIIYNNDNSGDFTYVPTSTNNLVNDNFVGYNMMDTTTDIKE